MIEGKERGEKREGKVKGVGVESKVGESKVSVEDGRRVEVFFHLTINFIE